MRDEEYNLGHISEYVNQQVSEQVGEASEFNQGDNSDTNDTNANDEVMNYHALGLLVLASTATDNANQRTHLGNAKLNILAAFIGYWILNLPQEA